MSLIFSFTVKSRSFPRRQDCKRRPLPVFHSLETVGPVTVAGRPSELAVAASAALQLPATTAAVAAAVGGPRQNKNVIVS